MATLAGGNSFNQLAVLATYNEAHLQAVCHYFRSLAVAHPFQVARENLLLLFDQARAKYERLPALPGRQLPDGQAVSGKGRGRGKAANAQRPRAPIAQLLPVLAVRFAHAHGELLCRYEGLPCRLSVVEPTQPCVHSQPPAYQGAQNQSSAIDASIKSMRLAPIVCFASSFQVKGIDSGSLSSPHCAGVLFCKINLDSFNEILGGAFADLDDLVGRPPVARGGNGEARRSDATLMQLTIMCLFAAWNADYSPPGRPSGCVCTSFASEIAQISIRMVTRMGVSMLQPN